MMMLAASAYTAAFAFYLMFQIKSDKVLRKTGFALIIAGAFFHTAHICITGFQIGHIPAFGVKNSLLLASWSVAVYFVILFFRYKVDLLGGAVSFFLSIAAGTSFFLPQSGFEGQNDLNIFMIALHVFLTFFANAAFFTACIIGIFYIIQERNLKEKKHGVFFKNLPSLEILESAGNFCITAGFIALTAGLASGIIWSRHVFGYFFSSDPKEIWSFIVWLLYAAIIHGRFTSEWRGRKAAVMSVIGFCIIVFSFIGINIFMDSSHSQYFMGSEKL
ncbi:MAG: cytochrome C assembly family protein [Thermodesulfobacteriota bacterium]